MIPDDSSVPNVSFSFMYCTASFLQCLSKFGYVDIISAASGYDMYKQVLEVFPGTASSLNCY